MSAPLLLTALRTWRNKTSKKPTSVRLCLLSAVRLSFPPSLPPSFPPSLPPSHSSRSLSHSSKNARKISAAEPTAAIAAAATAAGPPIPRQGTAYISDEPHHRSPVAVLGQTGKEFRNFPRLAHEGSSQEGKKVGGRERDCQNVKIMILKKQL